MALIWVFRPSENWCQGKLSEYEFIGVKWGWSEDLQYKSKKVIQVQTTLDNSELCPSYCLIKFLKTYLIHTNLVPVQMSKVVLPWLKSMILRNQQ